MPLEDQQVLAALRTVKDPELFKDIVVLGKVKEFQIDENTVRLRLDLGSTAGPAREVIESRIKTALSDVGVKFVEIQHVGAAAPATGTARPSALPQIKYVIAVGAGKGGVGKSTLALNIASVCGAPARRWG